MSYYRASLSEAKNGNLRRAYDLAQCSLFLHENTAKASQLIEILSVQIIHERDAFFALRAAVDNKKFRDALKIKLPDTGKSHTIRGMLYRKTGRYIKAHKAFRMSNRTKSLTSAANH
jgi:hypothetical protein